MSNASSEQHALPATATASPPRVTAILMTGVIIEEDGIPTIPLGSALTTSRNMYEEPSQVAVQADTSIIGSEVHVTAAAEPVDTEMGEDHGILSLMAEFVSATFLKKPGEQELLGIRFCPGDDSGEILIDSIDNDSRFHFTPLRVGYKLVSINGKNSFDMDAETASALIQTSVGTVTVVAHNMRGNASIVATMVEKPSPDSHVGLGLRQTGRGSLQVTKVKATGLFAHSLLNVGDRVLQINQVECSHITAQAAIDIIKSTPRSVTLVTEIQSSVAMVLAASAERTEASTNVATAVVFDLNEESRARQRNVCYCTWMIIISLLVVGLLILLEEY